MTAAVSSVAQGAPVCCGGLVCLPAAQTMAPHGPARCLIERLQREERSDRATLTLARLHTHIYPQTHPNTSTRSQVNTNTDMQQHKALKMEQIVLIEPLFIPFMCNNNTHTHTPFTSAALNPTAPRSLTEQNHIVDTIFCCIWFSFSPSPPSHNCNASHGWLQALNCTNYNCMSYVSVCRLYKMAYVEMPLV